VAFRQAMPHTTPNLAYKENEMNQGINAPTKPQYEGQIVRFESPISDAVLYDIAKRNPKYGYLEWCALNEPTEEQIMSANWV
jgi:hypothetical protein